MKKIEPSLVFMKEHLNQPLQVSQLASLCGFAPAQFFKLFKCATGRTPIDFFTDIRMCRACELLMDPALKIKDVGTMVGYSDRFYFSRVFKSVNGITPSEYHRKMAESGHAAPAGRASILDARVEVKSPADGCNRDGFKQQGSTNAPLRIQPAIH